VYNPLQTHQILLANSLEVNGSSKTVWKDLVGTINFWGFAGFLMIEGGAPGVFSLSLENNIRERGWDFGMWTWGRSDLGGEFEFEVEVDVRGVGVGAFWYSLLLISDSANEAPGRV
jgi:hypothetical protein